MGGLRALFLASAALLCATSLASAADLPPPPALEPPPLAGPEFSGWYLRGDVGVAVSSTTSVDISPNPLTGLPPDAFNSFYHSSVSAAGLYDAGVGYQFNNWLRFDVTGEYRGGSAFQTLEQVGIPSAGAQYADFYRGDLSSFIGMANAYVDLGTWYGITPFVGGGVGWAHNRLSSVTDTGFAYPGPAGAPGSPTGGYLNNGATDNFAWALMAGLDFNVTQNLKLELGYRYLDYGKVKSGVSNCFNGNGSGGGFSVANCGGSGYTLSTSRLASSDFRIGLRWTLGEPTPPIQPEEPLVRKY